MSDLFSRLGLRRIVNVSGTETTKGASPVCPEVVAAVSELVPNSVEMAELQSAACQVIARAIGTEAGCVTNCTAAGIVVAVAACMTGRDLARAERLPDTTGMKNEVILQKGHNVTYGGHIAQNVRLTGARAVEIGAATECGAYQLRHAIGPQTAAGLYVVSHHTVQSGLIDLGTFCEVCHEAGVPVIVDGAAEPDPRAFVAAGADLVVFSAQKAFAGFTAGIMAGKMGLVQACMYQDKGIARPMKAAKESVVASIAALERWRKLDQAKIARELDARLRRGREKVSRLPGLTVYLDVDATSRAFSRLHVHVAPAEAGLTACQLADSLWAKTPSIFVRSLMADIGLLQIDFRRVSDQVADWVCDNIADIVTAAQKGNKPAALSNAPARSPNLADLTIEGLEKWPLPVKIEI
ncbi:MAG: aminotransferase class V-fold PLP-dependent enzyme [Pseudomonadota bacterium]